MLKIRLLGKTKIQYLGEDLKSRLSSKTIAMIYLLIAGKGRYLSKSKLMLYLWPESAEEAARYNLRYNLWILKKVLPLSPEGEPLILSDKDSCILNDRYPLDCDLLTIKNTDPRKCSTEELLNIKALFTGSIMEGWYLKNCSEFNEFILFDRMTCESRYMEILSVLAERYEAEEDYGKALEILKEQAALEPENEELALRIMKMYRASGNRTGAISYYRTFETALWNSLKITPEKEIKAYCKSLCSGVQEQRREEAPQRSGTEDLPRPRHLTGCCLKGVDFFLISDLITSALQNTEPSLLLRLDRSDLEDLGTVNRAILCAYEKEGGQTCTREKEAPAVRIITAFSRYIELLAKEGPVELSIAAGRSADPFSAGALAYLQNMDLKNLKITFL